jgi:nucleotide-binding universal stress UspA family protein
MKIKKILVPTDFSKEANNAFNVAVSLSKQLDAEVSLLHVIDVPLQGSVSPSGEYHSPDGMDKLFVMKLVEKVRHDMDKKAKAAGIKVHKLIDFDRAYSKIVDLINKHEMDLVVMGSKGSSGFSELLVGSNTEKVVRLAPCPVLTVKSEQKDFQVRNVVFASSFTEPVVGVVEQLIDVQTMFNAQLHLVKVNTPNNFQTSKSNFKKMEDFAAKFKLENFTTNIYDDVSEDEGILNFADHINADLIVIPTHGRTGLAHLLNGSIAEDVVNHSAKPVLTIRTKV